MRTAQRTSSCRCISHQHRQIGSSHRDTTGPSNSLGLSRDGRLPDILLISIARGRHCQRSGVVLVCPAANSIPSMAAHMISITPLRVEERDRWDTLDLRASSCLRSLRWWWPGRNWPYAHTLWRVADRAIIALARQPSAMIISIGRRRYKGKTSSRASSGSV